MPDMNSTSATLGWRAAGLDGAAVCSEEAWPDELQAAAPSSRVAVARAASGDAFLTPGISCWGLSGGAALMIRPVIIVIVGPRGVKGRAEAASGLHLDHHLDVREQS